MPRARLLALSAIAACVLAVPASSREADKEVQDMGDWGSAIDPDDDCTFKLDRKAGRVSIVVPGKAHLLSVEVPRPVMNAPRVLRNVSGDFVVRVKATGPVLPGDEASSRYAPYHGEGLLIWQDRKNYVRLERAAYVKDGKVLPYVNFEHRKNGRLGLSKGYNGPDGPISLAIERRDGEIHAAFRREGEDWTNLPALTGLTLTDVRVGVFAINAARNPLTAEFEGFELSDKPEPLAPKALPEKP